MQAPKNTCCGLSRKGHQWLAAFLVVVGGILVVAAVAEGPCKGKCGTGTECCADGSDNSLYCCDTFTGSDGEKHCGATCVEVESNFLTLVVVGILMGSTGLIWMCSACCCCCRPQPNQQAVYVAAPNGYAPMQGQHPQQNQQQYPPQGQASMYNYAGDQQQGAYEPPKDQ